MKNQRDKWRLCASCYCAVKEENVISFCAFGLRFLVCKKCAKQAVESIEKALKERERE